MSTRDKIAIDLYKRKYSTLSAWGQSHVRFAEKLQTEPVYKQGLGKTSEELEKWNEQLYAENAELWRDLHQARLDLENLKEEYEDHISRCAGERED